MRSRLDDASSAAEALIEKRWHEDPSDPEQVWEVLVRDKDGVHRFDVTGHVDVWFSATGH